MKTFNLESEKCLAMITTNDSIRPQNMVTCGESTGFDFRKSHPKTTPVKSFVTAKNDNVLDDNDLRQREILSLNCAFRWKIHPGCMLLLASLIMFQFH
jgi:hypothetical protein